MLHKYIIVEDEPLQVENLIEILSERLDLQRVGVFNTAMDAFQFLTSEEGKEVGLMFLDIQMPEQNGLSLLQSINNLPTKPQAIVISAHEEYAIEGYNYDVAGYIVKPVFPQKLFRAIDKVVNNLQSNSKVLEEKTEKDYCLLKIKKREIKIYFKELIYCESSGNDLLLMTLTENYELRGTLKEMETLLPKTTFMRIHNGFLVNLNYIIGHENFTKIFLRYDIHSTKYEVPVGGKYRDFLKDYISKT